MIKPTIPLNELERLKALRFYEILDTDAEIIFDSITRLAAAICEVPVCLISLIDEDRQWFKSRQGLEVSETPRDVSFCGHAINQTDIFYIKDASKDIRFMDNPLVTGAPNVIFYAGKPLIDRNGHAIGTLCVIDHKPRELSPLQLEQLKLLGEQAIFLIQSRIEIKKKDEAYSLLTKLSKNLPGFIYTYQLFPDGKCCFPYSSDAIKDIYEVTPEDVKFDASLVHSRVHPDDLENVKASIALSAKTMTNWNCVYRVVLPTLGVKWLRGNANPEVADDQSILWHGYISDISAQKTQEEMVKQSLKMASLGEMAAGIAHEINNPLAIITMASQQISQAIKRHDYNEEKLEAAFDKINKTANRISKIIKGLKFFSGVIPDAEFKSESIINIVEDTISLCSEKFKIHNVDLRKKYPANLQSIQIDCRAVEISQVVLNLLNNSFDAIENLECKWIEVEIINASETLIIAITDCGPGLTAEQADKIMMPFYTTKKVGKGTGLGLSISQGIIEAHGGKMALVKECKNTRFVFEIPKKHLVMVVAA